MKGWFPSPRPCTKKKHQSPDVCRIAEALAHGRIKNISAYGLCKKSTQTSSPLNFSGNASKYPKLYITSFEF